MTQELLARWRDLVDRVPQLSDDALHQEAEGLHAESRRALGEDPSVRAQLIEAFRGAEDVARWLAGVVLPPGLTALDDPDSLRGHPEVRLAPDELPVAPALALSLDHALVDDPAFRDDPLRWTGSWVGGSPSVPRAEVDTWRTPAGPDGAPLRFVLQVDLGMEAANQGFDRWPATGLPDEGVLQVFHDLSSDGWDEAAPGACHVRLADDVDVDLLALADPGEADSLVPLNPQLVPTCPGPRGPGGPVADTGTDARHARVRDWLDLVAVRTNATDPDEHAATPWHETWEPVAPVSRLGGFGHASPDDPALVACLERRLPLTDGDRHVLLLDLDVRSPEARGLPDDLPGGRHLEVWMRAGDLAAGRFAHTWAVVRAGS